ncbi:caspase family protein [Candidatus Poribacteria bacterium]|nr:caspase family protein [Candidatus Poribacteria bacterium]
MKRVCLLVMIMLTVFLSSGFHHASAEGYAVLVGINDYMYITPKLNFCENDVKAFKQILIEKAGFKPQNIKVLLSKDATKVNIMKAITQWLADRVKPGDKTIFYFSGHGVQLSDDNGDEADGKDEVLCAYDSALYDITFIRDDELDRWFHKINTTDKIVVLDCCHSGTATKDASIWNTVKEYYPDPKNPIKHVTGKELEKFKDYIDEDYLASAKGLTGFRETFENTVLVSACDANQVAVESQKVGHGLLTYYLTKGLAGPADLNKDGVITVEEAATFARKHIKSDGYEQDPQLEGDYVGKSFVGAVETTIPYGLVKSVSGKTVKLSLGKKDDMVEGSIYTIFPSDATQLTSQGKGKVKIVSLSENESLATLIDGAVSQGDKAVLYAKPITSSKLLIYLEDPITDEDSPLFKRFAGQLKSAMTSSLKKQRFIQLVDRNVVPDKFIKTWISKTDGGKMLKVRMKVINVNLNKSWQPYEIKSSPGKLAEAGRKLIEKATEDELKMGYVLKNLIAIKNPAQAFKINLSVDKEVYKIGDTVKITVQPERDCYITVLDITTSGKAYVLFPNQYEKENLVRAGQRFTIPSVGDYEIEVGGPPGIEMVKVIATTKPLDLSSLNPDDPNSPIKFFSSDNLFQLVDLPTKDLNLVPVNQWATESVTFKIGERNIYKEEREPLILPMLE